MLKLKGGKRNKPAKMLIVLRVLAILLTILIVLGALGGLAYAWYITEYADGPKATTTYTKTETAEKSSGSAAIPGVSVVIESLTSPIAPGGTASVAVKTNSEAKCTIDVMYDTTPGVDPSAAQKTADKNGIAKWTWVVAASAPEGAWPVKVLCMVKNESSMTQGEQVVNKKAPSGSTITAPTSAR